MRTQKQVLPGHFLLGIVLAGIVAVPVLATPAAADHERRGRVEIRGMVVSIDFHNRTFHVQARGGRFGGHTWAVVVDRRTDFEFRRRRDRDHDDEDFDHERPGRGFRRLAVGDLVEVEGRLIDQGTILARGVEVFRRGRIGGPPPFGAPPIITQPVFTLPAPVISFPIDGSVVARNEFIVSGRTVRQARVHIKVAPIMGPVALQTHDFETDADSSGFFSAHIAPARLLTRRGMQYQITVVAESQGVQSPPTTLIVHAQ
ncbi:MAG: DUF5666 domain-containing protein [Armatimonadota bacterium]